MPGPGGVGDPGFGGGVDPNAPDPDDLWVHICVEVKGKPAQVKGYPFVYLQELEQKWFDPKSKEGRFVGFPLFAPLYQKGSPFFKLFEVQNTNHKYDPLPTDFGKRLRKAKESKKDTDLLPVAAWALQHGLLDEFRQTMTEVGKLNDSNPTYKAYLKLREQLKKSVTSEDPAIKDILADLKKSGYREFVRPDDPGHYAIYTKQPPSATTDGLLRRRIDRLEDNLQIFYYWFLIQNARFQPEIPKHQLPVVLITSPSEFQSRYEFWGEPLMHDDGFTPRRDNIMFLSSQRQDEDVVRFDTEIRELLKNDMFKGIAYDDFLTPDLWKRQAAKMNPAMFALAQKLCIIHKAMIEESERATLTHEGARQLLVASGVLPRNVRVPEWLLVGLSSYFETPVGAPYTAIGAPHWHHAIAFKYFRESRKLDGDKEGPAARSRLLVDVITDRVFRKAQRKQEDLKSSKDREVEARKAKEEAEFARASSWALTYYLIKDQQVDKLMKYREELVKMPRDLPLDEKTLKRIFAQSFGLSDRKGRGIFDENDVRNLTTAWFDKLNELPYEVAFLESEQLRIRKQAAAPPKKAPPTTPSGPPGYPGGPGLPPGIGGPGGGPGLPPSLPPGYGPGKGGA